MPSLHKISNDHILQAPREIYLFKNVVNFPLNVFKQSSKNFEVSDNAFHSKWSLNQRARDT